MSRAVLRLCVISAEGTITIPASPDCFSPATSQVALLKLQVDLMEGN